MKVRRRLARSFARVTDWHRWLGAKGDNRNVARAITGACNLGFLFLVMSGFYLWWPRNWNLKAVRNVTWFRRGLPSKARDFNWHNVIGFWSAVPLFIVVLSAVVISYTWAGNLVYRVVGETPPAPRANQPPASLAITQLNPISTISTRRGFVPNNRLAIGAVSHCNCPLRPRRHSRSISTVALVDNHKSELNSFSIVRRAKWFVGNLSPRTRAGRQLRSILRFAHTGEVAGIAGQTIAGLVSTGGAVLVITGLALAIRRFRAWVAGRSKALQPTQIHVSEPIQIRWRLKPMSNVILARITNSDAHIT